MLVVQGTVFAELCRIICMEIQAVMVSLELSAGVQFLRENPEKFIESNFQPSWMHYLISILCTDTWADGIITQAVANVFNLRTHSIESYPEIAEITIVETVNAATLPQKQHAIFIGHLEKYLLR